MCRADPDWLTLENQRIFSSHWIAIALTWDVSEPGTVFPATAAGQSLIVVRDENDDIRVFHNVCRHRGARLIDQPCRTNGRVVCPYHAWSYNLQGENPQDYLNSMLKYKMLSYSPQVVKRYVIRVER